MKIKEDKFLECDNVRPNLPYLPKMYSFRFFSINLRNISYPHLFNLYPS